MGASYHSYANAMEVNRFVSFKVSLIEGSANASATKVCLRSYLTKDVFSPILIASKLKQRIA
jgi:hypothetical protein